MTDLSVERIWVMCSLLLGMRWPWKMSTFSGCFGRALGGERRSLGQALDSRASWEAAMGECEGVK